MSTVELPIGREVTLADRYELSSGEVLMTGVQALVRLIFDQMRADRGAGRSTGALVSGYRGSPLGGFDMEIERQRKLCEELNVAFRPGINEELAATSVWGSQLAPGMPDPTAEGVLGVWYGKAPGVDRAADALRHGNFAGAHPLGGMLALCGDDPSCKSSTLPSSSQHLLAALRMPVVYPASPAEILDLGRHAIAASRASGAWVALKIATNVADGVESVPLVDSHRAPTIPSVEYQGAPFVHTPTGFLASPISVELERTLAGPRLEIVREYSRLNDLNPVLGDTDDARIGIVAAGDNYLEMREALGMLGLEADSDLEGVRLLKVGMVWPLDPRAVRDFAAGLETIVVVEEKGPLMESQVKEALFDLAERPRVLGQLDEDGAPLFPASGTLDAALIADLLEPRLRRHGLGDPVKAEAPRAIALPVLEGAPVRTPFYCSGCPHNRSTAAPEDALVGAGIGCHGMSLGHVGRGKMQGLTQMGGEGAQWIGQSPFTGTEHIFQNLGDGTFNHSGSLAIRAAVAAEVNMTYKLLYNRAVAMTGGQEVENEMSVPALTHWLELEGVRRVIVTTDEKPTGYRARDLSKISELRPRTELMEAQRELAATPGVTVLIHDQACAAELRRLRKRGKAPDPVTRIAINERVCEGCGDCGQKSHCLSVIPVETEFGRKTHIHQSSCNKDYSCVEGDCPSFLKVIPGKKEKQAFREPPSGLPDAPRIESDEVTVRMIGVGGTGVVTVAQVLEMAAMLDGKRALGLDQTGLAQKGGPVVSDIRFLHEDAGERSNRAAPTGVDGYLAFDLIAAMAPTNLVTAEPGRTAAVISTTVSPTGAMIGDPEAQGLDVDAAVEVIGQRTDRQRNTTLDAGALAERLFGSSTPANAIVVGAAWQAGLIPVAVAAIEEAFRLNGVAIEANIAAFHWGRAFVARPGLADEILAPPEGSRRSGERARDLVAELGPFSDRELEELLERRVAELLDYQGPRLARSYLDSVGRIIAAEPDRGAAELLLARGVARNLYKLLAYKDEYEVARLHLDPAERERMRAEFGADAKFYYQLHPPLLRALGLKRKLSFGPWFTPGLRALKGMRRLRGTPLDVFGYAHVRRVERELPGEYLGLVESALPYASSDYDAVLAVCELPDLIRGYEDVKLRSLERYRARARELSAALGDAA